MILISRSVEVCEGGRRGRKAAKFDGNNEGEKNANIKEKRCDGDEEEQHQETKS